MAKKILLIVEGEADEVRFFKSLFHNCFRSADYQFFSYKTTIHVLAQELYLNYPKFEEEDIDIRLVLASLEKDDSKKRLLLDKYTDVFLVFDLDPQHYPTHYDTVRRMLAFFCDSTMQGKLYINYPMMQSYKHFAKLPDPQFHLLTVNRSEIKEYKKLVGSVSGFTDLSKYDYKVFYSLAAHHLKKCNYIINGRNELPSCEEYMEYNNLQIYDYEVTLLEKEDRVSVINTCVFVLFDYAPKKALGYLTRNKGLLYL